MRLSSRELSVLACGLAGALTVACIQAVRTYPLAASANAPGVSGSVQLERVEGGQTLVVVELEKLPPPERFASGLTEFVVWLEGPEGARVNAGALRYDRAHQAGSLLATTQFPAFTVRVTGERDARSDTPSDVLLATRAVTIQ
jgi:hypothetical protein